MRLGMNQPGPCSILKIAGALLRVSKETMRLPIGNGISYIDPEAVRSHQSSDLLTATQGGNQGGDNRIGAGFWNPIENCRLQHSNAGIDREFPLRRP